MKWISNEKRIITIDNVPRFFGEPAAQALQRHLEWRAQFIIGTPQAIEGGASCEELKRMGYVGFYKTD